jgi:accessory gene regulator B
MLRDISTDIAFVLIKNKIIDIEQRDVYVYGVEVFLLNAGLITILFAISLITGTLTHFCAFLIFFCPLRIFAGGYHAATSGRCLFLSITAYVVTLVTVRFLPVPFTSVYAMAAMAVFVLLILIFAPLVNKNNELSRMQLRRNKIIMRVIIGIDLTIFFVCFLLDYVIVSSEIVFTGLVCVLLLIGRFIGNTKRIA